MTVRESYLDLHKRAKDKLVASASANTRPIVRILMDEERTLSDGYEFYCDERYVLETLERIALRILDALDKTEPISQGRNG